MDLPKEMVNLAKSMQISWIGMTSSMKAKQRYGEGHSRKTYAIRSLALGWRFRSCEKEIVDETESSTGA
jgi:hypothetical protein